MKKLLLFTFSLLGLNAFSQLTCATALPLTVGSQTCPQITGTYPGTCAPNGAVANPNSIWYAYTATATGELTITSDFPENDGTTNSDDTRLSILVGTCTTLSCYAGDDDISATNYLTTLTIPVQSGTTYYVVWDDRWSDKPFTFDVSFATPACIRPNASNMLAASNITASSAQFNWNTMIGSPASYDIEYGPKDFVQGAGTIANTTTTNLAVSGLTPVSGETDYYIRNNCGAEQSAWIGPFRAYLAKTLPWSNLFDDVTDYSNGFTASGWGLGNATGGAQSGAIYYFSSSSATAATNAALYTRAISLLANEAVTMTYYTRLGAAAGTPQTLQVKVNTTPSLTGATQLGSNVTVSGATYTQQVATYTAPADGTYYFIFHNVTPIVTTATSLRLDTVDLTSVLSNADFSEASFSVSPNPAKDLVTINTNFETTLQAVEISDINGRVVKNVSINGTEAQVNIADLNQGVYLMKIISAEGIVTKKIIKE